MHQNGHPPVKILGVAVPKGFQRDTSEKHCLALMIIENPVKQKLGMFVLVIDLVCQYCSHTVGCKDPTENANEEYFHKYF